jgi:hypothetical protein
MKILVLISIALALQACGKPDDKFKVENAGQGRPGSIPQKPTPRYSFQPAEGDDRAKEATFRMPIAAKAGEEAVLALNFNSKNFDLFVLERIRTRFQCDDQLRVVKISLVDANDEAIKVEKGKEYTIAPQSKYILKITSQTNGCDFADVAIAGRIF